MENADFNFHWKQISVVGFKFWTKKQTNKPKKQQKTKTKKQGFFYDSFLIFCWWNSLKLCCSFIHLTWDLKLSLLVTKWKTWMPKRQQAHPRVFPDHSGSFSLSWASRIKRLKSFGQGVRLNGFDMLSVLSLPQIQLHQSVTHKSAVR